MRGTRAETQRDITIGGRSLALQPGSRSFLREATKPSANYRIRQDRHYRGHGRRQQEGELRFEKQGSGSRVP